MKTNEDIIVLRSVFDKAGIKYYIQPCKDPKTGRLPACVKPVDSHGDLILTDKERNSGEYFVKETETIIVENGTTFDLTDEIQRKTWEAIKHSIFIAPERFAKDDKGNYLIDGTNDPRSSQPRYGTAELYVDRPGYEAQIRVSRKKLVNTAITYVLDDERGPEGRIMRAKLLGRNMNNKPDADVTDFLLEVAEKDPNRIIKLYTGDDLSLRILFIDARDKKVILTKNGVYIYGDTDVILGATDDAVLTWMKSPKNKKTLELLKKDTYPENYINE